VGAEDASTCILRARYKINYIFKGQKYYYELYGGLGEWI
jgi:hypothetical protein